MKTIMAMYKTETQGWVCPKCGRVYAPWIDKCQYCGSITITCTPPTCPYTSGWSSDWINTTQTNTSITSNMNIKPDTTITSM